MDRQEKVNELMADLDELMRNVTARVTELRKQPDSPERRAELDTLKNAMLGVHRSLDDLAATLAKKYGDRHGNT